MRVPLSHELFGGIIPARRPSVTTALGRLEEQGLVIPRGRPEWLVRAAPGAASGDGVFGDIPGIVREVEPSAARLAAAVRGVAACGERRQEEEREG